MKPRRNVLFLPATNARAAQKARTLPCDGLIFDLEDSIAPADKKAARAAAQRQLAAVNFAHREVVVRINGLDTAFADDDIAALGAGDRQPDAVLLPKVEGAGDIAALRARLDKAGSGAAAIWAMMETPAAIIAAAAIASAGHGLAVMVMGSNDLAKAMKLPPGDHREALYHARAAALMAARAGGIDILDGVYNDIGDTTGFADACACAARLGFDGKTVIHPAQVDVARRAFSPGKAAIANARRIVAAFAEGGGKGVIAVDGRMIEALHVEEARRILALAKTS